MSSPGVTGRLTVATVTYQSAHVLPGWLANVAEHVPDADVIVVDNGSTDGSADLARESGRATVLDSGGNVGFARACNAAAAAATTPFVWFLNPDARIRSVDEESLAELLAVRPFGLIETATVESDGSKAYDVFRHRGERGEWLAHVVTPLWPRVLGPSPWRVREGDGWASGASLIVNGEEFRRLGCFDPGFFLLYEDRELSLRAARAGLPVGGTDAVVTSHTPGGSSKAADLATRRRAWAFLSWIEFVCATAGAEEARRAAGDIVRALRRLSSIGGRLEGMAPRRLTERLKSSGDVLREAESTLDDMISEGFYTRASQVLAALGGVVEQR